MKETAAGGERGVPAIEKRLVLEASPERVWRSLTEPSQLASWFPDKVEGLEVGAEAEGWVVWEQHGRYAIRFEEIDAPRRLVWSWARNSDTPLADGPTTRVEWTLEPREDGGTTLRLKESGFTSPEDRAQNVKGWDHELGELVAQLGR